MIDGLAFRIRLFAVLMFPMFGTAMQFLPVSRGTDCSSVSYYGTSPESPDGKTISFVTYADTEGNGDSVVRVASVAQVTIDYDDTGHVVTYEATPNYAAGKSPGQTLIESGLWLATERNEWIRYDLGAETAVRAIDIKWAGDASRSYLFKVDVASATNGPWSTVYEGRAGTNRVDFETFDFSDTTGRYVRLTLNGWKEPCELWVCDRDGLTNSRKLCDFDSDAHNGGEIIWLNNTVLAFQAEPNGEINVMDIETGETVAEFIYGKISQNSSDGRLAYAVNSLEVGNWQSIAGQAVEQGIYVWDLALQRSVQVCSSSNLAVQLTAAGAMDVPETDLPPLSHLQFSPDGSKLSLRWDGIEEEHLAIVSTNGMLISTFPDPKPLHFLWYDNDTVMGVEILPGSGDRGSYKRWNLDGSEVETLAGVMTHAAASPDRRWVAGETANYNQTPIPFVVFRSGETVMTTRLWEHGFTDVMWSSRNHVNPSFSKDGSRLYFNMAIASNLSRAAFIDISELERVEASHDANSNIALNTVDGDLSTCWSTSVRGAWIQYDLSDITLLNSVACAWKYRNQYLFTVSVATNDAGPWTTVVDEASFGETEVFERYSFPETNARFVRITLNGRDGSSWAHLSEVNLLSPDDDGDGLSNVEEVSFGSSISMVDTDGDGADDLSEWIAGTSATNASNCFSLSVIPDPNGAVVEYPTVFGRNYRIEAADHPGGSWETLSAHPGSGSVESVQDKQNSARFYRGQVWK